MGDFPRGGLPLLPLCTWAERVMEAVRGPLSSTVIIPGFGSAVGPCRLHLNSVIYFLCDLAS